MKKIMRNPETGLYHINGQTYKQLIGSRQQVYHGTAYKTEGGLKKEDILMNKWGRIVSRKKYVSSVKEKRLEKHGYFARKGKFGYVRKTAKRSSSAKSAAVESSGESKSSVFGWK